MVGAVSRSPHSFYESASLVQKFSQFDLFETNNLYDQVEVFLSHCVNRGELNETEKRRLLTKNFGTCHRDWEPWHLELFLDTLQREYLIDVSLFKKASDVHTNPQGCSSPPPLIAHAHAMTCES